MDRVRSREQAAEPQSNRNFGSLRPLIGSLVEYAATAIELGERRCPPPPPAALEHARKAAWAGVSTGRLHRLYVSARTVFSQRLWREARSVEGYRDDNFAQILASNDIVFEGLLCAVEEELEQEREDLRRSPAARELDRVKALLAGELLEAPDLDYDLTATHIGVVGSGPGCGR